MQQTQAVNNSDLVLADTPVFTQFFLLFLWLIIMFIGSAYPKYVVLIFIVTAECYDKIKWEVDYKIWT